MSRLSVLVAAAVYTYLNTCVLDEGGIRRLNQDVTRLRLVADLSSKCPSFEWSVYSSLTQDTQKLRQALRRLSREVHPDKNKSSTCRMEDVSSVITVLHRALPASRQLGSKLLAVLLVTVERFLMFSFTESQIPKFAATTAAMLAFAAARGVGVLSALFKTGEGVHPYVVKGGCLVSGMCVV